jgi:hypothetical protein
MNQYMGEQLYNQFKPLPQEGFIFENWLLEAGFSLIAYTRTLPDKFPNDSVFVKELLDGEYIYIRVIDRKPHDYDIEVFSSFTVFEKKEAFFDAFERELQQEDSKRTLYNTISCIVPQNQTYAEQLMAHHFSSYSKLTKKDMS